MKRLILILFFILFCNNSNAKSIGDLVIGSNAKDVCKGLWKWCYGSGDGMSTLYYPKFNTEIWWRKSSPDVFLVFENVTAPTKFSWSNYKFANKYFGSGSNKKKGGTLKAKVIGNLFKAQLVANPDLKKNEIERLKREKIEEKKKFENLAKKAAQDRKRKEQEEIERINQLNKPKTCYEEVSLSWNLTSNSAPFKFTSNSNKTIKIFNVSLKTADNSLIKNFYKDEYIKPFHVWSDFWLIDDLNKDAIKYLSWNCKYEEQKIKKTSSENSGRSYAKNVLKGKFNSAFISAIFAAIGGVIGFFVRGKMGGVIGAIIAVVISKLL